MDRYTIDRYTIDKYTIDRYARDNYTMNKNPTHFACWYADKLSMGAFSFTALVPLFALSVRS